MDFASLVGIISGFALILSAILLGGDFGTFINIPGMMIVFGGTISATLLTFPLKDIITAFKSAFIVFGTDKQHPEQLIQSMLQLTQLSRRKGLLALADVKTNSPFLKRACNLIADASNEQMIRHVLRTEINSMKARHYNVQDVFKKMATYSPAFGMLGTLIGLIQMLSTLDDPDTIGPSMAVALLTTFYGSLLATVVFIPIAGKLKSRTMFEVINLEIMFEGAICILKDNNQLSVYEKLSSYLPRKQRPSMGGNSEKSKKK
ncbi:MAG: motility protein A [Gammaproteobacteria bacterium]|nr:motility protein A [Gammaproteobacteria bacterium]